MLQSEYPLQHRLLPPNVRSCCLTIAIDDPDAFNYLSPLGVSQANLFFRPTLERAETADEGHSWYLEPTSTALYRLNTTSISIEHEHLDIIPCLPCHLTTLHLSGGALHADWLIHLPPQLITFVHSRPDFVDGHENWVRSLPRTLKTLDILRANINGTHIIDLPPKLEVLRARFASVTLAHLRNSPHSLRIFTCYGVLTKESGTQFLDQSFHTLTRLCTPFSKIHQFSDAYLLGEVELARGVNNKAGEELYDDIDPRTTRRYAVHE